MDRPFRPPDEAAQPNSQPPNGERLLLTPEEVGEVLRVGRCTVYDLIRTRALVSVKIGRRRLVPVTGLHAYIESLSDPDAA
jgi:excisionase family DNA binding protein